MFAKFWVNLALFCLHVQHSHGATDKVICYVASWAIYRPDKGEYHPKNIDPNICTHINYAFLGVYPNGTLQMIDEWGDIEKGNFAEVEALKEINPNLKTIISIGGWNAGNAILAPIAASPELRANLIASSFEYFEKYGFNGLDIDWEYPEAKDKENFITLLREIKEAFQPKGHLLTIAVSAIPIDDAYDIPGMSENVDVINLMTYDFHIPGGGIAAENSPLYWGGADTPWQREYENVNSTVVNWVNAGADPGKLTIGLAFYGHTFQLADPAQHDLGAPVIDAGMSGPYTKGYGVMGFNEICEFTGDWTRVFDDQQKVPYKYKDDQWIGYDDEESVALKVQFAKDHNMAGLMIWTVDMDDFLGLCGPKNGLLEVIKQNL
ncbi:chitinase 2 precursor [Tribolium castaneum]|uniref:Chitinase 2 n=1 Tax=Tribolium castaneum TaxID=7070 RepID=Q5FYY9_TRICA|nr:chitinase 2 precursor [Tribolium castaneum]AAW67569.2 chitinase 2 [Tribolium castaneum]|eukprot:NP_001034516.3 chitinase 2 precursor [Tribolium castaneum]